MIDNADSALAAARSRAQRQLLIGGIVLLCAVLAIAGGIVFSNARVAPASDSGAEPIAADDPCAPEQVASGRCAPREVFVSSLRAFQNETRPALAAVRHNAWAPVRADEIDEFERAALAAFEEGDYARANAAISNAETLAQSALQEGESRLAEHLNNAQDALADDRAGAARRDLEAARQYSADSTEIRALETDLSKLEAALPHLQRADAARAEGRPDEELKALRAVLAADSSRDAARARIAELELDDQEQRLARAISAAENALDVGNIDTARRQIAAARAINPRAEVRHLVVRADDLDRQRAVTRSHQQATEAAASDQWREAQQLWGQVLARDPTHAEALVGQRQANQVVSTLDTFEGYLADPLRLGTTRVATAAYQAIENAADATRLSPRAASQAEQLRMVLSVAQTPVEVAVRSDGQTHIEVRGIGIVGRVSTDAQRVVRLNPGRYEFEGRREGYRSRVVKVVVPLEGPTPEVTVVCDERIH